MQAVTGMVVSEAPGVSELKDKATLICSEVFGGVAVELWANYSHYPYAVVIQGVEPPLTFMTKEAAEASYHRECALKRKENEASKRSK